MTDSQMAVMVTVLPIVMSSVKQKNGPSLNFPKTVAVDVGLALQTLPFKFRTVSKVF